MTSPTPLQLDPKHRAQLAPLGALLTQWNKAHNLVSRKLSEDQLLDLLWEATAFERFLPSEPTWQTSAAGQDSRPAAGGHSS